jgi:hypothetical protein
MGVAHDVTAIIFAPEGLVKSLQGKQPCLLTPFAIFAAGIVLNLAAQAVAFKTISGRLPAAIPAEEQHWNRLGFTLSLVSQGVGGVLFWFVGTGILYCLAILLDGEGEYRKLLEATGYAHVPFLIFCVVALAITFTYEPKMIFPADTALTPELVQEVIRKEVSQGTFLMLKGLNMAFYLWVSVLCVVGLRYVCKLPYSRGAVCFAALVILVLGIEFAKRRLLQI